MKLELQKKRGQSSKLVVITLEEQDEIAALYVTLARLDLNEWLTAERYKLRDLRDFLNEQRGAA